MANIKEVFLISGPSSPSCMIHHNVPALVFSTGGVYTGNFFHEFNDGFIPLFIITVRSVFPNQDFILVISEAQDWWLRKYADLLGSFSKHPIIHLENDTSATVGLMSHGFLTISSSLIPAFKNFTFHAMLENAYGQNHHPFVPKPPQKPRQQQLVLASRSGGGGRMILNQGEVARAAEEVGFDVIVFKPMAQTPLSESYGLIKSNHAMIGVHGSALTHQLFLRPGSVIMQIVPIGAESVSKYCYGNLTRELKLEYVEYKIGAEESSLVEKYGKEDIVLKNPVALQVKGWSQKIMDIYLHRHRLPST